MGSGFRKTPRLPFRVTANPPNSEHPPALVQHVRVHHRGLYIRRKRKNEAGEVLTKNNQSAFSCQGENGRMAKKFRERMICDVIPKQKPPADFKIRGRLGESGGRRHIGGLTRPGMNLFRTHTPDTELTF